MAYRPSPLTPGSHYYTHRPSLPKVQLFNRGPASSKPSQFPNIPSRFFTNLPPPPPPPQAAPPSTFKMPPQRPRAQRDTAVPPLHSEPKTCPEILGAESIANRRDFLKWALKNHPDKGGDTKKFQKVSGCIDQLGARRHRTRKGRRHTKKRKNTKRKSIP